MAHQPGTCRLLLGPMFSKKTTRLIEEAETLTDLGIKCLFINHSEHQRETASGDQHVSTHASHYKGLSTRIDRVLASNLSEVTTRDYKAYFIDEGQFFPDLVEWTTDKVMNESKIVIVAGLDGDFNLKPFGRLHDLESICEQQNIVRLTAFCKPCLDGGRLINASFTSKIVPGTEQKDIGGYDKYLPVCMRCYMRMNRQKEKPVVRLDLIDG